MRHKLKQKKISPKSPSFIILMAIIAIFYPTTLSGQIQSVFTVFFSILLLGCFVVSIFLYKIPLYGRMVIIAFFIMGSLLFFTFLAPFNEIRMGGVIYYLTFSIMICTNLKYVRFEQKYIINIIRILALAIGVIGLCMIFDVLNVNTTVTKYYAAYYQELYPLMIYGRKPVITFATQSVAGFVLFLFLFLLQKLWSNTQNILDFCMIVVYYFLMYSLKSFTGLAFIGIGLLLLFFQVTKKQKSYLITFLVLLLIYLLTFRMTLVTEIWNNLLFVFNKHDNGLMGRYGSDGALGFNIEYITRKNFTPVGFSFNEQLSFVDSGYIEYYLRGGIVLFISMLLGFFMFIKKNVVYFLDRYILIVAFFLFELGFSGMIQPRIVFLIPFVICSCNALNRE